MAYITQEEKKEKAPAIKAVLKKYGVKGTLGIRHYSTLILNIKSSAIDFLEGMDRTYLGVNTYQIKNHHEGIAKDFLTEVHEVMNTGNYDESDVYTDYFNVGFYTEINIGKWDKPYILVGV